MARLAIRPHQELAYARAYVSARCRALGSNSRSDGFTPPLPSGLVCQIKKVLRVDRALYEHWPTRRIIILPPETNNLCGRTLMAIDLQVNGKSFSIEADPNTPLLWVIREERVFARRGPEQGTPPPPGPSGTGAERAWPPPGVSRPQVGALPLLRTSCDPSLIGRRARRG